MIEKVEKLKKSKESFKYVMKAVSHGADKIDPVVMSVQEIVDRLLEMAEKKGSSEEFRRKVKERFKKVVDG